MAIVYLAAGDPELFWVFPLAARYGEAVTAMRSDGCQVVILVLAALAIAGTSWSVWRLWRGPGLILPGRGCRGLTAARGLGYPLVGERPGLA